MIARDDLASAVAALRAGDVVVYPTETVYGLGVDAASKSALEALLALKGRDGAKGLSVLVANLNAARPLLRDEPAASVTALERAFWPGPLTIVLPASPGLSSSLIGSGGGVGLRCSTDRVAVALLAGFGGPMTATSANRSGAAPATTVDQARASFGTRVASYLDDGIRASSSVSTVVEFFENRAYLRRIGAIDLDALAAVIDIVAMEG